MDITHLPTGDVYMSDGEPPSISDDLPLNERIAYLIARYDPEWDVAHDLADQIVALVLCDSDGRPKAGDVKQAPLATSAGRKASPKPETPKGGPDA